jgi:glycerol-3-phosphate dehydrogenase
MDQASVVIIGGGVVGCAIARQLSARWSDIFVLEALPKLAMGASSRNSGVIHSGLYYKPGSLKARHCLRGNALTYEFCARHGVPHKKTGKLVVAADSSQEDALLSLMETGKTNGVEGLRIVDRAVIRQREPHVEGHQAIDVPSTGIVSAEELVRAYARIAQDQGAHIVPRARVNKLEPVAAGVRVYSEAGDIETRCLINSAGLFADEIAGILGSPMVRHRIYPVRGEYYELVRPKQPWVNGLVYPLPHADGLGLGVHLTKTLAGNVLVGPNARYVDDKNNYEKGREPVDQFALGAKALLPEITIDDLVPAYSGIRAKLTPPSESGPTKAHGKDAPDFIIERDPQIPHAIHLMGIESPGLTSAPAIAEQVAELAAQILS